MKIRGVLPPRNEEDIVKFSRFVSYYMFEEWQRNNPHVIILDIQHFQESRYSYGGQSRISYGHDAAEKFECGATVIEYVVVVTWTGSEGLGERIGDDGEIYCHFRL